MSEHELLAVNPIVEKLLTEAGPGVEAYRGYVGPEEQEGYVSLYPNLTELGLRFQIRESDIAHVERIPEAEGPFGAVMVWVRAGGDVMPRSVAKDLREALVGARVVPPPGVEEFGDRLDMSEIAIPVSDSCTSNCECVSACKVCVSICRWTCETRAAEE